MLTTPLVRTGHLFIPTHIDGEVLIILILFRGSALSTALSIQFPPDAPLSNNVSTGVLPMSMFDAHRNSGRCLPGSFAPTAPPWTGPLVIENPEDSRRRFPLEALRILVLHSPRIRPRVGSCRKPFVVGPSLHGRGVAVRMLLWPPSLFLHLSVVGLLVVPGVADVACLLHPVGFACVDCWVLDFEGRY